MTAPLPELQAGASARPWRTDRGGIFDCYGNEIAHVYCAGAVPVATDDEGRANAALIVQAVNSYGPLVDALRLALPIVEEHEIATAGYPTKAGDAAQAADAIRSALVDAAREALAVAREGRTDG